MPSQLATKKHAKYFQRLLQIMPNCSAEFDCSRLAVAFFAISGLDILNCLNDLSEETKLEAINWIYRLQVTGAGPRSGFQPSTTIPKDAPKYQCGHLAMTYIGLVTLLILGDDLSRVDKKSIIEGMRACQNPDGSFTAIITGCESDMRFLYCACCISIILNDWSGIDKTKAIDYILKSISYDGAMGQGPGLESHGGSTYCAVASLFLMNELHNVLTNDQLNRLKRWCLMRQDSGFHGRPGKPSDTCYSFWVGATLQMLDINKLSDPDKNRAFLLETQDSIVGGFGKFADCLPDPLHTYLGLCGLSLLGETDLCIMNAALNISDRAYKHLLKIQEVAWGTAVMELQSWLLYHLVAVTDCNQVMQSATTLNGGSYPAGGTGSRARDLGLRAQKKLLGRVVSTGAGRSLLIDDATTSLLDNLYKLMERAAKTNPSLDKKQPEKVLKNIVKLSIKVGLLQRNQQLNVTDDAKLAEIRTALRAVAMSVVSFYELEFSFDRAYLIKSLERCRTAIQTFIKPHLTDKSQDRCDQVFDFLTHSDFLDSVFRQDSEHRPILGMLVSDINKALDAGHL